MNWKNKDKKVKLKGLFTWNNKLVAFSLLEVLVSSAILSLILTLIFGSFGNFTSSSKKSEVQSLLKKELTILKRLLEEDFRSAIFLTAYTHDEPQKNLRFVSGIQGDDKLIGAQNADQVFLHINRNLLSYSEVIPEDDPNIHEVGYFVAIKEEGKFELYRREQYYINQRFNSYIGLISKDNIAKERNAKTILLTENIFDFDVKYLDFNLIWVKTWNSISNKNKWEKNNPNVRTRIPRAVEISLSLKKDNYLIKDSFQINLRPKLTEGIFWGNF